VHCFSSGIQRAGLIRWGRGVEPKKWKQLSISLPSK